MEKFLINSYIKTIGRERKAMNMKNFQNTLVLENYSTENNRVNE